MKKLFLILILILSSAAMSSCYDAYYAGIFTTNETQNISTPIITTASVGAGIMATGSFIENDELAKIGTKILLKSGIIKIITEAATSFIQNSKQEELLILSIANLAGADSDLGGDRRTLSTINSLTKKVKKQNAQLELNDILEQIRIGFDDEDFCKNDKLYRWKDIQDYVLHKLK